jgi:hypothetical protein
VFRDSWCLKERAAGFNSPGFNSPGFKEHKHEVAILKEKEAAGFVASSQYLDLLLLVSHETRLTR